MKRSEVNKALRELEAMCQKYRCYLPPFCHFTPEEWETKGHEYDEVRDCCLGWDITDYGQGISIRSASPSSPSATAVRPCGKNTQRSTPRNCCS